MGIAKVKTAETPFALILLDYQMPGKNGAVTAVELRPLCPESILLMHSGDDSREALKATLQAGVMDFIDKDVDMPGFKAKLEQQCRKYEETLRTLRALEPKSSNEELIASIGMVGRSQLMAELAVKVAHFRDLKKPVLVLGETGTGKELVARALHKGNRNMFYAINCANYTDKAQILEAELFGYEKGAFTGADQTKPGIFQMAKGGTVFLDELHLLSPGAQAQLLRALQEKKIRRIGGNMEIDVDFRLVAAAKPDLQEKVSADFFHRLNYLRIDLPTLAQRPEDIEPLVRYFCEKYSKEESTGKRTFLMKTVRMMQKYPWPGNVRELEGYVYRLLSEKPQATIDPSCLDGQFFDEALDKGVVTLPELVQRHDGEIRNLVTSVLKTSASKADAALRLHIKATTLHSIIQRLGILGV